MKHHPPPQTFKQLLDQLESWNLTGTPLLAKNSTIELKLHNYEYISIGQK